MTDTDARAYLSAMDTFDHFGVPRENYAIQTPPTMDECVCMTHVNNAWITYIYDHGELYGMLRHDNAMEAAHRLIDLLGYRLGEHDRMMDYFESVFYGAIDYSTE